MMDYHRLRDDYADSDKQRNDYAELDRQKIPEQL